MTLGCKMSNNSVKPTRFTFLPTSERSSRTVRLIATPADVGVSNHREAAARCAAAFVASIVFGIACVASRSVYVTAIGSATPTVAPFDCVNPATAPEIAESFSLRSAGFFWPRSFGSKIDMATDDIPPLIRDLLYAERYQLLDDPVGEAVKRIIALGVDDEFIRDLVTEPVRKHKIAQAFAGPFDLPSLTEGEIVIGLDVNDRPIQVPVQAFNGHALTIAGSGAGKTFKSRWLILQIAPRVKGMWLFDLRKAEFRCLVPLLARLGIELIVVPARFLKINPLQVPDHVDPQGYAPRIADLLVQALRLPPRATKLLHLAILDLYEQFGVFGGQDRYPTLFELRERIAGDRNANAPARQAIVDSLDPVLVSLRSVLCFRKGWPTSELARRHLLFAFAGLSETDKDLLVASLLLSEFTARVEQGVSNPRMDLWINADEAARLISAGDATTGLNDLIGLVRGTGIGLDLSGQVADVSRTVLSNTANKFIGRVTSATDLDAIGASIGLSSDQRRYVLHTLSPGMFVGQVGTGPWRYPFLFRVPRFDATAPGVPPVPSPLHPLLEALPSTPAS